MCIFSFEKYWKLTELEQKQDLLWTWNYSQKSIGKNSNSELIYGPVFGYAVKYHQRTYRSTCSESEFYYPKHFWFCYLVIKHWERGKRNVWLWYRMGSSDPRQNIFFLFLGSKIWFPILCALAGMWALYTWWSLTRMCLPALVARNRPKTHIWLLYGYYWCRLRSFRGNHQNGLSGPFPSFLATCDPLDPCCDFFLGVFELCFHFKSLR